MAIDHSNPCVHITIVLCDKLESLILVVHVLLIVIYFCNVF